MHQPKRTPEDTAKFATADQAIDAAIEKAKQAGSASAACGVLDDVAAKLGPLATVKPPVGHEHEFAEANDGLGMALDYVRSTTCPDAQSSVDDIADGLEKVRDKLNALEAVGA